MTTLKRTARIFKTKAAAGILTLGLAVVGICVDEGTNAPVTDIGKQAATAEPASENELIKSIEILLKEEVLGVSEL